MNKKIEANWKIEGKKWGKQEKTEIHRRFEIKKVEKIEVWESITNRR